MRQVGSGLRRTWLYRARFPPIRMPAEQGPGVVALELVSDAVRKFLIAPVDNHALPASGGAPLIDLDRDERIAAHPIDLLAQHRERIEMIVRMGIIERYDVRLSVFCAGQPSEAVGR